MRNLQDANTTFSVSNKTRSILLSATALGSLILTQPGNASDLFLNPISSSIQFNDGSNWDGGIVPGAADDARFYGVNQPSTYTVNFSTTVFNDGASLLGAQVTFELDGNDYFLTDLLGVGTAGYWGGVGTSRAELTLLNGRVAADRTYIGGHPYSDSALVVDSGATLNNDTDITVAWQGVLAVNSGGTVNTSGLKVQIGSGVTNAGALNADTLNIGGGATVSSSNSISVGMSSSTITGINIASEALVTGSDSSLEASSGSNLIVGGSANGSGGGGSLTVSGDGLVDVTGALQVWDDGTVENTDSTLNSTTLAIEGGGTLSSLGITRIGTTETGVGTNIASTATVSGSNSTLEVMSSHLSVGESATGSLVVSDNGLVEVGGDLIVWGDGAVGNTDGTINADTLTIEGGGTVSSASGISVGTLGKDAGINIASEALVTGNNSSLEASSGGNLIVGMFSTDNGLLKVEDNASTNTTGGLVVGLVGTGELAINSGGSATSGTGVLGFFSGSKGTVSVAGTDSNWTTTDSLYVGGGKDSSAGEGTLTVSEGGLVDVTNTLQVWDDGAVENTNSTLNGNTLIIEGGGTLSSSGITRIGTTDTGVGTNIASTATVSGSNSTLEVISSSLNVGESATGGLTVSNNALVDVGGDLNVWGDGTVGNTGGTINSNTLNIEDGGTVFSSGTISVGTSGTAAGINIASSAVVSGDGSTLVGTETFMYVGVDNDDPVNRLEVKNLGEVSSGILTVGFGGNGTMEVTSGGKVSNVHGYVGFHNGTSGIVTVAGSDSQWNSSGSLLVGGNGASTTAEGSLTVSEDGLVDVSDTLIVWSGGTVTLDGGTINAQDFDASEGTFNFNDGALTVAGGSFVDGATDLVLDGAGLGDTATLNLVGGSASYDNATIGQSSGGVLALSSGAVVDVGTALIVRGNGAVTSTDSTLISDTLAIEGGGDVYSSYRIDIGTTDQGDGRFSIASSALVTGSDSTLTSPNLTTVGYNASGMLAVEEGANISTSTMRVGTSADGTLNINSGGKVSSVIGEIAWSSEGPGTVTVAGSGSQWTNSDSLYVGGNKDDSGGDGSLTVSENGLVDVTNTLQVWDEGTVTVTGGHINAADIVIESGGVVSTQESVRIGNGAGSALDGLNANDLIEVDGGLLEASTAFLTLGQWSDGTLDILNGGEVNVLAANLGVQSGQSDTGTIKVAGVNSQLNVVDDLSVGHTASNTGVLEVASSAMVTATNLSVGGTSGGNGGEGSLTVSGDGQVDVTDTLQVWDAGTVTLVDGIVAATDIEINAGGTIDSSHIVRIGADISLDGVNVSNSADVTGNGALLDATGNTISVGRRADGTLNISDGGRVVGIRARVGDESLGYTGTINIAGDGSELDITNTVQLGYDTNSTGILNMTDSARLEATALTVGGKLGSNQGTGIANIDTNSVVDIATTTVVYDAGTVNFTDGTFMTHDLSIEAGGTFISNGAGALLDVADTLQVETGGTVTLAGGSVTAASINNEGTVAVTADSTLASTLSNTTTGRVEVSNNATLTLAGDVTHNGEAIDVAAGSTVIFEGAVDGASDYTGTGNHIFNGSFGPGNSPGLVNIAGDVTYGAGHTLTMELAGLTAGSEYDVLAISGTATLGGLLDVDLLSGFLPSEGDSFDLLTAATLVGTFNFDTTLGDGLVWDLQYLLDDPSGQDVVRLSAVSAVPIPAAVWLFGSSLLGLVAIGRRRRVA